MDDQMRADPPRERIIMAARKLFDAKGFHKTTTAELAAEAAVSIGQIYRLFENKDDVVLALVEENTHASVVSEEWGVGKDCVNQCRHRGWQHTFKKQT